MRTGRIRSLVFLLMVCLTFVAVEKKVLATGLGDAIWDFCSGWYDGDGYDCEDCNEEGTMTQSLRWNGTCDFSGIEDEELRDFTSMTYVQDAWGACDETCGIEYIEYVIDWLQWTYPQDECYEAWEVTSNWMGWANPGGSAGTNANWSCQCEAFFFSFCD